METMRRKAVSVLLAGAMTLGLAAAGLTGCGSTGGGKESIRLMVWSPQNDQSKDNGEWLQTMCEAFADEHPEWEITFVYGIADEAGAAGTVSQDAEASADVFMYANDTLTTMTDANALAKFGGKYREQIESMNSGVLNSIVDSQSKKAVVFYQVNMKLIDIETNQIVWNGQKQIKKYVKRSKVSW